MRFPVKLEPDGAGWMASVPDVPEALTSGETKEQALQMARDALIAAIDFYFEDRRPVPAPSRVRRGQPYVDLPASLAAKVLLLNEMLAQQVRPAELARRLNMTPQEVTRLVALKHSTKIDALARALEALGKRLELSLA